MNEDGTPWVWEGILFLPQIMKVLKREMMTLVPVTHGMEEDNVTRLPLPWRFLFQQLGSHSLC